MRRFRLDRTRPSSDAAVMVDTFDSLLDYQYYAAGALRTYLFTIPSKKRPIGR